MKKPLERESIGWLNITVGKIYLEIDKKPKGEECIMIKLEEPL